MAIFVPQTERSLINGQVTYRGISTSVSRRRVPGPALANTALLAAEQSF